MRGLCDNGYVSLYCYDADGNRTVKEHLGGEAVWVNGTSAGQTTDTLAYSVYPNAYISINGDRWTKHYYIGGERVASRTGTLSGGFQSLSTGDNYSAGHHLGITVSYDNMCQAEEDSIAAMYERFEVPYDVQHASTRGYVGHLYIPITRDNDDTAETAPLNRNHPHLNDGGQVYYFHRDHLGGTLSVTDSLGAYVQQVEYTPWGEVFVEKQSGSSGYESPYLFNGKELDEETGLYYYGARYYDPKMSVWYSTDYDQEKYPHASSYCYTLSNPINAIDPNGKLVIFINGMNISSGGKAEYWNGLNNRIMSIVNDNHQRYYDGSIRGVVNTLSRGILTGNLNPYVRYAEGVKMGFIDAEHIFNSLKPGETIKIFTHSMGAAYGKGFIIGLKTYAKLKHIDINRILEFEVDLAPYQSNLQSAVIGVKTVSIGHYWDGVAGPSLMPFAKNYNTRKKEFTLNPFKEHSVNSFTLKELEKYVPNVKGIEITNRKTWEQYGTKEEK